MSSSGGRGDRRAGLGPETVAGEAAGVVRPYLDRGEEILWAGQPDRSVLFSRADYYLVPFSMLVLAVGLIWAGTIGLLGWIFAILGVYMVFGRFFWKAHRKRLTYYAVTGKRVVRVNGMKGKAQPFAEIPGVQLSLRRSGNGTIRFSKRPGYAAVYQNSGMEWVSLFGNPDEIAFHDIADAEAVHDLVMEKIREAQSPSTGSGWPEEAQTAEEAESAEADSADGVGSAEEAKSADEAAVAETGEDEDGTTGTA